MKLNDSTTPSSSPSPARPTGGRGGGREGNKLAKKELVSIAFELGFIIALPIVAFGFAGKWLDARFGSEPLFTLLGILIAIGSTSVWIYRKFKHYFNQ